MMTTERNRWCSRARPAPTTFGTKRSYRTYYEGRNLQRVAFTENGVTYWVSNTLKSGLEREDDGGDREVDATAGESATVQGRHRTPTYPCRRTASPSERRRRRRAASG